MTKEDKKELKLKITALIQQLESELVEMEDSIKPISPENSIGRISRMDAINNKSVVEAAYRSKKKKLSQLKIALSNIENEDFGVCSDCKNIIQAARLIYMPESTKCIRCASRG